ncbi:MAG: RagB/SusD family nutrient uptake outer membrane protein [Prolixibacteraceae bacterium]|nr:RagB/SusD family nutrient uptake outer membrane protein [Prolixibacteraceae bacterium]
MKNRSDIRVYKLLVIIGLVYIIYSCSDKFFEEQAGARITPDKSYKSMIDVNVSVEGAVMSLQDVLPKLIIVDGLRSDQMDVTSNTDGFLEDINNHVLSADNPYLDASDFYKVIININEVLANIDEVSQYDRSFDTYVLHYTKGALIGLRSWTYLNLLKLYGQAAWIDNNLTSLPENLNQITMSKEVLIDTLINQTIPYIFDPQVDKHVEIHIPYVNTGVTTANFPPLYVNSKAVLGELYLEKGDFAKSAIYLKMALESYTNTTAIYKVDKTYTKDEWKNIFIDSESGRNENIAVMPYNSNQGQNNPLAKWLLTTDMFMVKPTQLLVSAFRTQMPLKGVPGDLYRGMGITIDTTSNGVFFISKYSLNRTELFSTDIIMSRAADLHLLLAEALNRLGDSKTALILLNSGFNSESVKPASYFKWSNNQGIRGRVYLAPKLVPDSLNGVPLSGANRMNYIEDLIIDERALELSFEGKRWFDLVRIATRRNDPSYLAEKVAAKFAGTANYDIIYNRLLDPTNWYLPFK